MMMGWIGSLRINRGLSPKYPCHIVCRKAGFGEKTADNYLFWRFRYSDGVQPTVARNTLLKYS